MSFDHLAPFYRAMEFLSAGGLLQKCRLSFLQEIAGARQALILGEGPGRYLSELVRRNPHLQITCVDSSSRMLEFSERSLRSRGLPRERIRFVCADAREWPGENLPYDLVATHFFLDCFQGAELQQIVERYAQMLKPGGAWVISDFAVPEAGWQRWRAQAVLKIAYMFFRWSTGLQARGLGPPQPILSRTGLTRLDRRSFNHGLLYAERWRK